MNVKNRTIYCKDNIDILCNIDSESIDLIYLDPPFNKNKSFAAPIGRTAKGASFKDIFTREDYKPEWREEFRIAYKELYMFLESMPFYANESDVAYIAYMAKRVIECHRILKSTGSLFYHCDDTMQHYIKVMLDTIFGRKNFINEINWQRSLSHSFRDSGFNRVTDAILFYRKSDKFKFNMPLTKCDKYIKKYFRYTEKETGRKFMYKYLEESTNHKNSKEERTINGKVYKTKIGWRWSQKTLDDRIQKNPYVIYITKNNRSCYKLYEDEWEGKSMTDVWTDIPSSKMTREERTSYPTQKPLNLLKRIIACATKEGQVLLDPFCGCATACIAAEQLHRKWIGIDVSVKAYELVKERLLKEVNGFNISTNQYDAFGEVKQVYFEVEPPVLSKSSIGIKKWIYIFSNPSHKGYKVGIASDWKQRLNGYQTSDPKRGFKMEYKTYTEKYQAIEKAVHSHFKATHEWVEADLDHIISYIRTLLLKE